MSRCHRCKSRSGRLKQLFLTFEGARQAAEKRGWDSKIYKCPHRKRGYHLSHKEPYDQANY